MITPAGTEIYFSNPSGDGGVLDVDDCIGGSCTVPGSTHVENVFFESSPMSGTYEFFVDNYDCADGVAWAMEVAAGSSTIASESGTVSGCGQSEHFYVEY